MKQFIQSVFTVSYWIMITRIIGLVRTQMQAVILGTGIIADAISASLRLPAFIRRYLGEGGLSSVFIPIYAKYKDETHANEFANCVFSILLVISAVLFCLLQYYMTSIMSCNFPGWYIHDHERFNLLVWMSRFMITSSLIQVVCAVYSALLSAKKEFSVVSKIQLIQNITIVAVLYICFYNGILYSWSIVHASGLFVIACEGGAVLSNIYIFYYIKAHNIKIQFITNIQVYKREYDNLKGFFIKLTPNMISASSSYLAMSVSLAYASQLDKGVVACVSYAEKVQQLPISVLGTVIGNVVLAMLSSSTSQKEEKQLSHYSILYSLLTGFFSAAFIYIHADTLIAASFLNGAFDIHALHTTSKILSIYVIGVPAAIMLKVLQAQAFSRGLTLFPLISSCIGIIAEIYFIKYFAYQYGFCGIAAGVIIASWINIAVLMLLLAIYIKDIHTALINTIKGIIILACASYISIMYSNITPVLDSGLFYAAYYTLSRSYVMYGIFALSYTLLYMFLIKKEE